MTLIAIDQIVPNPEQPRTLFDEGELQLLAQSITANGLIQPIVVEPAGDGYILVDGERRLRACQSIGWTEIEAHVRAATNHGGQERLAHALVANIQRAGMGPVDEALAYRKLVKKWGGGATGSKQGGGFRRHDLFTPAAARIRAAHPGVIQPWPAAVGY